MKLDLHGKTIHEAWRTFKDHTEICRLNGIRKFVVVTGYGKIYEELPKWTDSISCISEVQSMAPNFGCYKTVLKRPKKDYKVEISSKNPTKSRLNLSPLLQKYGKKG